MIPKQTFASICMYQGLELPYDKKMKEPYMKLGKDIINTVSTCSERNLLCTPVMNLWFTLRQQRQPDNHIIKAAIATTG